MSDNLSPEFVEQMLAAQSCAVKIEDAALIAANLSAQLRTASAGYDTLAFEAEPSGFDVAMRQGAIR
ncbi:MAG: hypothetical protein ACKO8O_00150 [Betaproteobacteria bacterium]